VVAEACLTGHPWSLLYEGESAKCLSVEIIAIEANCLVFLLGKVDQLLALLYAFKIFIYIEYFKTYHFV